MSPAKTKDRLPFNPAVLRWARDWAGFDEETAAAFVNVPPGKLLEWERQGTEIAPTVRQARILADRYGRAFLEFFMEEPPALPEPALIPDFRLYRGEHPADDSRPLKQIQMWAEVQRDNALDLYSEIGEEPSKISEKLFVTIDSDIETAAATARKELEFPIEEQAGLSAVDRLTIPGLIRDKIEAVGVLTLKHPDLKHFGVRGFCLADFPLPVIIVSGESPNAQAFTLGHEFAHVMLRQSAISGSIPKQGGEPATRRIEEWCNRFSAAFLMPLEAITAQIGIPAAPRNEISDDELGGLAAYFGVSRHAMLLRLVHVRVVREQYYWDVKKPQFDQEERDFKAFGRPRYYGRRYVSSLGRLYTTLVIEALNNGRITNHNAAEFMGIKNFDHLRDIRQEFGT